MSRGELFPAQLNEAETTRILIQQIGMVGGQIVEDFDYINRRRQLLGPVADIRHPEFGRPNPPEETFRIGYEVREKEVIHQSTDSTKPEKKISIKVYEYIFDCLGNEVSVESI